MAEKVNWNGVRMRETAGEVNSSLTEIGNIQKETELNSPIAVPENLEPVNSISVGASRARETNSKI